MARQEVMEFLGGWRCISSATQRKAVFPVSGGDVTLTFPETMTIEGVKELEDHMDVFLNSKREALLKHGDIEGPAFNCHGCGKFTSPSKVRQWNNHLYCRSC